MLCIEWQKERLSSKEAFKAIGEMINSTTDQKKIAHLMELSDKILSKEVPDGETDSDIEQDWWNSTHEEE
jgi:hypothetical protein